MNEVNQKTLVSPVKFTGIGLHSGQKSEITINPAKENEGIIFKRIDLKENNIIEANFKNVSSAKLCTTLENKHGAKVSTVEHLLAALYITGIDNAFVEINCEEVPIMDGSSRDFLTVLSETNLINQTKKRKYLKISNKIELVDGEKKISIEPHNSLEVDFQLKYENKIIGKQKNIIDFQNDDLKDVSSSRTFCLFEDIKKIKKNGLAKGGSLENAVVVDKDKILNDGGLRNDKEFVNHKILDCLGDLYTSGYRVVAAISCSQGGHYLTNQLLRKVFNDNSNFSIVEIQEKNLPHTLINKSLLRSIA